MLTVQISMIDNHEDEIMKMKKENKRYNTKLCVNSKVVFDVMFMGKEVK